ncbi:MAG TPA: universal stress protein [Kofleriaceae bacterium]|jgi:nucleotide-binding universal stress UspA family protein
MTSERFCILVALDDSEYAEIVLEHAIDQAARHDDVDFHAIVVVGDEREAADAKPRLAALVGPALELLRGKWRAHVHVRAGEPANEIANLAADVRADLIVVGRFGLHHPHKPLGSIATAVIEAAPCPTLVVGLVDRSPDAQQCPACVAVRAATDGERWFCDAHSAPDRAVPATAFVRSTSFTDGGLMW